MVIEVYLNKTRFWKNLKQLRLRILVVVLVLGFGVAFGGYWHHRWFFPFPQLSRLKHNLTTDNLTTASHTSGASNGTIQLKVRDFRASSDKEKYDSERDSLYRHETIEVDLKTTALVLIDVWSDHPNDGWMKRARQLTADKLVPLITLARRHDMMVFHAPHDRPIAADMQPQKGEINLDDAGIADTQGFHRYLQAQGVNTLIYAGYSSNVCVLHRPVGIIWMKQKGYNVILIRDCTIAFENPETLEGQWANKLAIHSVEIHWGQTTTLQNLADALRDQE